LSADDLDALVAFLKSLTEDYDAIAMFTLTILTTRAIIPKIVATNPSVQLML